MTKREWIPRVFVITAVIGVLAVYRLLPHPWNFTPVVATAIFGGMYLSRSMGMVLPIGAMLISDLFMSFDWVVTPAVYGSILIAAWLGHVIVRGNPTGIRFILRTGAGTIGSSVVFFVLTNFAVWISSGMYTLDVAGLVTCYVRAIPFFGNTLAGDMIFIACFVSAVEGIRRLVPRYQTEIA